MNISSSKCVPHIVALDLLQFSSLLLPKMWIFSEPPEMIRSRFQKARQMKCQVYNFYILMAKRWMPELSLSLFIFCFSSMLSCDLSKPKKINRNRSITWIKHTLATFWNPQVACFCVFFFFGHRVARLCPPAAWIAATGGRSSWDASPAWLKG